MQHPGKRFVRYTRNISIFVGWGDGSRIQVTVKKTPCSGGLSAILDAFECHFYFGIN